MQVLVTSYLPMCSSVCVCIYFSVSLFTPPPLLFLSQDAIVLILLAIQWLTRTAYELLACAGRAGKGDVLGADDVFPLLVNVLAHSNIPCIHLIMVTPLC